MGTITKDFSYREFEKTDVPGMQVQNTIATVAVRDSVKALVENVLQPLRDAWGKPLAINSGYRCPELNAKVGGVPTSQHAKGEAADVCPFGRNGHGDVETVRKLAAMVRELNLPFDQMMLYNSFVHISHRLKGGQRGQVLYAKTYKGGEI